MALNEDEVVGLRIASSDSACELLVHVGAQPEPGAKDADPRRVLRLLATRIRMLLREDRQDGYGPAIALAGLDDVESFFASLGRWDAMYGWEFLDRPTREPVEEFIAAGRRWWDVPFGRLGNPPQVQATPVLAPIMAQAPRRHRLRPRRSLISDRRALFAPLCR